MTVIGLDLSLTGSGVVVLVDGQVKLARTIRPAAAGGVERLLEIEKEIARIIEAHQEDLKLVGIEGYAMGRANNAFTHEIGALGGIIRRMIHLQGVPWREFPPSTVKKFCTGAGNAKKDLMLLWVFKHWGMEFKDDNIADAFVIAKMAEAIVSYKFLGKAATEWKLTKYQAEALEAVSEAKQLKKSKKGAILGRE